MLSRASFFSLAVLVILANLNAGASEPAGTGYTCAAIEDAGERLACYDEAFGRSRVAAPPEQGDSEVASQIAPEPLEEFGLSEAQLRARDPDRAPPKRVENVEGTVTGVAYRSTGERVITLDNGQVWLLTEATVRGPLREGDAVIIRRAALNSFQLVTPGRVALRARRIE